MVHGYDVWMMHGRYMDDASMMDAWMYNYEMDRCLKSAGSRYHQTKKTIALLHFVSRFIIFYGSIIMRRYIHCHEDGFVKLHHLVMRS